MTMGHYTIELPSGRRFTARPLTVGDWLDLYHRLPRGLLSEKRTPLSGEELGSTLKGLLELAGRAVEMEPEELGRELTPEELAELVAQVLRRELDLSGDGDG